VVYVIETNIQAWVDSHVKPLIETINKQQQTISDQERKYCSNNKLAEQSAKISKLEHKTTEQGWTTKNNMLK
jgi:hypothetical protein